MQGEVAGRCGWAHSRTCSVGGYWGVSSRSGWMTYDPPGSHVYPWSRCRGCSSRSSSNCADAGVSFSGELVRFQAHGRARWGGRRGDCVVVGLQGVYHGGLEDSLSNQPINRPKPKQILAAGALTCCPAIGFLLRLFNDQGMGSGKVGPIYKSQDELGGSDAGGIGVGGTKKGLTPGRF